MSDKMDTTPIVEMDLFRIDAPSNLVKLTLRHHPSCKNYPKWRFDTSKDWLLSCPQPAVGLITPIPLALLSHFHSAYST